MWPAVLLGLPIGAWCFARSMRRPDFALHALIVVMFFGGLVGVNLGSGAYPIMFRDAFIVLPLYLGFFGRRIGQHAANQTPVELLALWMLLLIAMFLSVFGAGDVGLAQMAIGTKVWFYYIPFFVVGLALASAPEALTRFLRQLLFWGLAACLIGLAQSLLVRIVGFETVMAWFFGVHAVDVTQGFGYFDVVGGIYRMPGTFSFSAQYAAFLHFYIAVAMVQANADPNKDVRRIARWALFLSVVAAFLCGAREAILTVPLTLALYVLCGLLRSRLVLFSPVGVVAAYGLLRLSGLDLVQYFFYSRSVAGDTQDWVWDQISRAFDYGAFGGGVGSSTGAARYAVEGLAGAFSDRLIGAGFESYFAKAAAELGWLGFATISLLMMMMAVRSVSAIFSSSRTNRAVVAPLAIYVLYNVGMSFKAYVLDTDPGNVMIWLSLGLVVGLARQKQRVRQASFPEVLPDAEPAALADLR